jgi:hypothetical protein
MTLAAGPIDGRWVSGKYAHPAGIGRVWRPV